MSPTHTHTHTLLKFIQQTCMKTAKQNETDSIALSQVKQTPINEGTFYILSLN